MGGDKIQTYCIISGIGILSMFLSLYLIYDHIKDEDSSFCDVGSYISCSKVRRSIFSELFNVPIAVFGLLFNLITTTVALITIQIPPKQVVNYIGFLFYLNIFGVTFIFYLISAEIYLGALCPFCTILHVLQMITMWLSYKLYNSQKSMPSFCHVLWNMKEWFILIGFVNLIPLLYFNSNLEMMNFDKTVILNPEFSQCITHSGWIFYGLSGCGWCSKQKELFGDTLDHIVFIDCKVASEDCKTLHIDGYPTWIQFDDYGTEINRWKGFVSLETWEILSDCRNPLLEGGI